MSIYVHAIIVHCENNINSNTNRSAGVIEFLTSGRVAADHRDFKDLAYKSCLQKISGCDKPNEFTHSFKLASAYSEDIMPYTNYT